VKRAAIALVVLAAAVMLVVSVAGADTARVQPWPYERVWPAAVRFLRVDRKLKVIEKDEESGYVLFEFVDDGKTFQASMELSRTEDDYGRKATRVQFKISGRPGYVEDALLEKLELKLKDELGEPAPPPKKAEPEPKAPKADAGVK
jgi:hypothetical protein